jgi:hypothetical protein
MGFTVGAAETSFIGVNQDVHTRSGIPAAQMGNETARALAVLEVVGHLDVNSTHDLRSHKEEIH